jgi:hypothetical protein
MNFTNLLLTDTAGKKSSTLTVFIIGAMVVNIKLLLSGVTIAGITFSEFTGAEYGMALGALGGIYVMRRSTAPTTNSEEGE